MPETRRSKRMANHEETAPRFRLTTTPDPLLSSPEFSTDLYSTHSTIPMRAVSGRGRGGAPMPYASSSNSMDVDTPRYGTRSQFHSDDETMSDEELNANLPSAANGQGGARRRYNRRQDPGPTHALPKGRSEAEVKVMRNREAAQQFRQRQREHMLVLQAEHERLMEENRAYQEHMSRLRLQKEDLDRDLNYARSFLEHTMSIAMANLRHSNRINLLEPVATHA